MPRKSPIDKAYISNRVYKAQKVEEEEYTMSRGYFKTTGVPKGWFELPTDFMLWMIVAGGKVLYVSAGKDFYGLASRLCKKYKGDRVLYMPTSYLNAEETVAALIAHYQPPYNFRAQSYQLAELDAILSCSKEN